MRWSIWIASYSPVIDLIWDIKSGVKICQKIRMFNTAKCFGNVKGEVIVNILKVVYYFLTVLHSINALILSTLNYFPCFRYYSPGYSEILLDRVEQYQQQSE